MDKAQELYLKALDYFGENKLEEARKLLEEALKLNPDHLDCLEALGVILDKLDRTDEAIEVMKQLAQKTPDSIMPHTNLSIFYMKKGMLEEAENEKAIATTLSFGKSAEETQDEKERSKAMKHVEIEQRIETFKKMLELDLEDFLMHFSLAKALAEIPKYKEAEKSFREALRINPDYSVCYQTLGKLLEDMNRPRDAIEVYEKGIPIADRLGDLMPKKAMEVRLAKLRQNR